MPTLEQRANALENATNAELDQLILIGTPEQSAAARALRDAGTLADLQAALATFEQGTKTFVDLTAGLQRVIDAIAVNPIADALGKFNGLLSEANAVLAEVHGEEGLASAAENAAEAAAPVVGLPAAPSGPVPVEPPAPRPLPAPPAPAAGPPINASTAFDDIKDEYQAYFDSCAIRPANAGDVAFYREKAIAFRPRYEAVGGPLGIPWYFIAAIHALESSFNFGTHLHNGDPLAARTVHVPAGRPETGNPPFSWEDSATDALTLKGFDGQGDWSVPAMLYRWERYNGMGYRRMGLASPFLWSFSNHYEKGKFVRDHDFDANAVSKQCGAATLLRQLVNMGDLGLA
jgi:lysozyme family protein